MADISPARFQCFYLSVVLISNPLPKTQAKAKHPSRQNMQNSLNLISRSIKFMSDRTAFHKKITEEQNLSPAHTTDSENVRIVQEYSATVLPLHPPATG